MKSTYIYKTITGKGITSSYSITTTVHPNVVLTLESYFKLHDGIRIDILWNDKHYRFMAAVEHKNSTIVTWYPPTILYPSNDILMKVMEQLYDVQKKACSPYIVLHFSNSMHVYLPNDKPLYRTNRKLVHVTGYPETNVIGATLTDEMKQLYRSRVKLSPSIMSNRFNTSEKHQQEAAQFDFDKSVRSIPNIKKYIGDLL